MSELLQYDYGLGLASGYCRRLKLTQDNAPVIVDYLKSLSNEIHLSDNYKRINLTTIVYLSRFHSNKKFKDMTKEDIILYLNSLKKKEDIDPFHSSIATYNLYLIVLSRFFKWLYYPDLSPKERPKPPCIQIQSLRRKEQSIYKPTDLWTQEDDLLFLKYCPSKRDRCYHAISRDASCRPHELMKLKIKDVVFKMAGDAKRQYAEVLVNGKTGQRHIPLINSIPYLKDWIDDHPQSGNPDSVLICGFGKSLGRSMKIQSLNHIYQSYKKEFYPKLLNSPNVSPEDKEKIRDLLKKPWNPYIRRHSALTEKSKILKEHVLRQHAGWSQTSSMHQKYVHYFGNESSESILEAYGLINKNKQEIDKLKPKACPNCNEQNKLDSKFCSKCRMVLSYDAYTQVIDENESEKQSEITKLRNEFDEMKATMKDMTDLMKLKLESDKEGDYIEHLKKNSEIYSIFNRRTSVKKRT
ncbi:MAG: phage integrase N-terminal SAM-like domain-containing protein [Nitrososphaeraceae archaeon]